jgi:peptidoglycan/xylan/chitin deacetylase (PgdA/CDA1 family)
MEELSRRTRLVRLEDISAVDAYPDQPLVVISFDDGYVDFLENALPVLCELGIPAHQNICPGLVDRGVLPWSQKLQQYMLANPNGTLVLPNGTEIGVEEYYSELGFLRLYDELLVYDGTTCENWIDSLVDGPPSGRGDGLRLMTWDQIRECAKSGVGIGAHGLFHRVLTNIKDEGQLYGEIADCKTRIEQETGIEPSIFSFPFGLHDGRSMELVQRCGYKAALISDNKVRVLTTGVREEGFGVFPRIGVCRANWKEEYLRALGFHQKLSSRLRGGSYLYQ